MSPLDVARRMLRANCDPGLIAAYLALELELDPTIGMTPLQRIGYRVEGAIRQFARAFEGFRAPLRADFTLAPPGGDR